MQVNAKEAMDILETLAFQEAADGALHGKQHNCRLARLNPGSWQVEMIRQSGDVATVESATDFRTAMASPDIAVIFLPQTAMITAEIIERICSESPLSKMIIWETAA